MDSTPKMMKYSIYYKDNIMKVKKSKITEQRCKKAKNYKLVALLDADINSFTSDKGIKRRRIIAKVLKKILKIATPEKIIIDRYPDLNPNEPYIFVPTHGFSNDIIACLASIDRSTYLLMGSTNQVEYNRLMYVAWLNGFIYVNRTNNKSRKEAIPKMERILKNGSSVLIFPEGGHNNTENNLVNKLFSSPYILAKRTGYKVIPIAPFYEFGSDRIFMNFGAPIDLAKYDNKKEALLNLRDVLATMVYENIEKHATPYVRPTDRDIHIEFMEERRQEYLKNSWTEDVWEEELTRYLDTTEREFCSVMESVDKIKVDKNNAYILGPVLINRQLQKKYDFKEYMHKNWTDNI